MEYDKTHIYDEGEIKEFMALLREKRLPDIFWTKIISCSV